MKLGIAALAGALLLLLGAGPSRGQDASGTSSQAGTAAAPPREPTGKPNVDADEPKVDPKLLIDVFNLLTKPRRPTAQPAPPPSTPAPVEPAAVTPLPVVQPAAVPVAPRPVPRGVVVVPLVVKATPSPTPKPSPLPKPLPRAEPPTPLAAPPTAAGPAPPAEPAIAAPVEPAPPPQAPVIHSGPPASPVVSPAQRSASLLSQGNWLLLALLAAAAIAAAATWNRARRIARTRAALSLAPRLDLSDGSSCSVDGLALACPPMSIRTRLEMAGG